MFYRLFVLFFSGFFLSAQINAQDKGILPLTGMRYFNEGIWGKNIEVRVDGQLLVNNRLPLNKDFEIKLITPTGFAEDRSKMIFAAAEVSINGMKGNVLLNTANVFRDNESKGFAAASFKEVVIKLNIRQDLLKADPVCMVKVRYYDLKSKNQLRLEFPVTIARPGEVLQLAKAASDARVTSPGQAKTVAVRIKNINVTTDTSIRVNPKMAYTSLDMSEIDGTSISEVLSGKESYWVYDADLNEIKMTDKQLKQVGGAMETNLVNYMSKIPFRLKTILNKPFIVRFRWDGPDKKKIIDVVVTNK